MIHMSETLALQTVEDFLSEEERSRLCKIVDSELGPSGVLQKHVMAPDLAQQILEQATRRALPAIRRVMPSVSGAHPWHYVELPPGGRVPTHLNGIPDPQTRPRCIARLGVVITDAAEGGEFYIATTSSPAVWTDSTLNAEEGFAPGTLLATRVDHEQADDEQLAWMSSIPQSRWITDGRAGVAVAYGAQLMHGVTAVRRGVLRKFVTSLTEAPESR